MKIDRSALRSATGSLEHARQEDADSDTPLTQQNKKRKKKPNESIDSPSSNTSKPSPTRRNEPFRISTALQRTIRPKAQTAIAKHPSPTQHCLPAQTAATSAIPVAWARVDTAEEHTPETLSTTCSKTWSCSKRSHSSAVTVRRGFAEEGDRDPEVGRDVLVELQPVKYATLNAACMAAK